MKEGARIFKQIRDCNDKDFKIAEKNFQDIGKELDLIRDSIGKSEAGVMYALIRMSILQVQLFKKGILGIDEVENKQDLRLLPKSTIKFIAECFGYTQKYLSNLVKEGIEAEA